MKISDITALGEGVYELERGTGDRKPGGEDVAKILFGGIETDLTSKKLEEDVDVSLPSPLQTELVTLLVGYDGSYEYDQVEREEDQRKREKNQGEHDDQVEYKEDQREREEDQREREEDQREREEDQGEHEEDQGKQRQISDMVFTVISTMRIGQKVLILEEKRKKKEKQEKYRRKENREGRIYVIKLTDILSSRHDQPEEEAVKVGIYECGELIPHQKIEREPGQQRESYLEFGKGDPVSNYDKPGYLEFGGDDASPRTISSPREKPRMVQREVRMRVKPANLSEVEGSACTYTDSPGGLNPPERGTPELKARL